MQTIWLSPTGYVTRDRSLLIGYPSVNHPSTVVTSETTGDFKWASIGLNLPENIAIEELIICYQVSNPRSFISQVRLSEMATPDQAIVRHDDPTYLRSTTPVCYRSIVGRMVPTPGNAVTLELRLNFQNITDEIYLGAVGIGVREQGVRNVAVHVGDYGAVGDGMTDDREAIMAAILDAKSRNAVVQFEARTYRINQEIRLTGSHHVALVGTPVVNGLSASIMAGAPMRAVLSLAGQHTLRDISVNGNRQATYGLHFQGCSNSIFDRVGVSGALRDGVYQAGETDGGPAWAPTTAYGLGVRAHHGGNLYEVIAAGTSAGSGGPTGTMTTITDGTVTWTYLGSAGLWAPSTMYTVGAIVQNGQSRYECLTSGTSAGSGGPGGAGQFIVDGAAVWRHLSAAGVYAINDNNTWNSCGFGGNGSAWITGGLESELTGRYWLSDQRAIVAGGAADVTKGSGVITVNGIDLRTLALREGDYIRVGAGGKKRMRMVYARPVSATQLVTDVAMDYTDTGLNFAIMSGDGYHEEPHGDNNINSFNGGLFRLNTGAAFAFNGLYGGRVQNAQIDYNAYGVRVGLYGGSPAIGGTLIGMYIEDMHSGKAYKFNSPQNWTVISFTEEGGIEDNADIGMGTSTGVYINKGGMWPVGNLTTSQIPSTILRNPSLTGFLTLEGRGLTEDGPPGYSFSKTGTWSPWSNVVAFYSWAGNRDITLTGTPSIDQAIMRGNKLLLLGVVISNPGSVTLQDESVLANSGFRLRSPTLTLRGGEWALFFCDGQDCVEIGRSSPVLGVYGDATGSPGNVTQNTINGRVAIAAGQVSVTVTNNKVTPSSIIHATLQSSDATLTQVLTVVPGPGSFAITGNTAATAACNVCWTLEG